MASFFVCAGVLLFNIVAVSQSDDILPPSAYTMFPKDFFFGAGSSAYQYEGAWNEDGKGPSIWDTIAHSNPDYIVGRDNGDVALDSYHKYKEDVELLNNIGFQMYKFSISWPRVLPNGTTDYVNEKGVNYYNALINELLSKGIIPMVVIYHWDLPQSLEDLGGWLNPIVVDYFVDYADFVFERFGNRIKWWITINEGYNVAAGYGSNKFAPALSSMHGVGDYIVGHNLLLAHGKTYRLYEKKYKAKQGGKISMTMLGFICLPLTNSQEDIAAAQRCFNFTYGWFANPIFKGDYPSDMRAAIDKSSRAEGRNSSRLPYFTDDEIKMINGSSDYFSLNHYLLYLATSGNYDMNPSPKWDMGLNVSWKPNWGTPAYPRFTVVPQSIRLAVNKIKEQYGNLEIVVTESGYAEFFSSSTYDPQRIIFYESFLAQLRNAIYLDRCNVTGYILWSLLDDLEWSSGYKVEFGLVDVDVRSTNKTRRMKQSAYWMKNYIEMHKLLYVEQRTVGGIQNSGHLSFGFNTWLLLLVFTNIFEPLTKLLKT